jgi:UDP-glucuronate decarboxylase
MKNILVTGGAGFIGSHLCEALIRKGNKVVCVDDLSTGNTNNISHLQDNFKFVKGDANSYDVLKSVFNENQFDSVFHYAAIVGVDRTLENPVSVLNDIKGTQHILDLSKDKGVKEVIFASSSEVYGEPVEIPETEEGPLNAKLPYAVTKLMSEQLLKAYYEEFGIKTTSLRFFNVYGPKQDSSPYGFVVGIFIEQILKGLSPTIFGDGTQTRDFVYIEDNINAALQVLDNQKCAGEIINIGTGRPVTILDLGETLLKVMGSNKEPIHMETERIDIKHRFPDVSKMRAMLSFRPKYKLEEGLAKTIDWYKQKKSFTSFN